jgi:excisionase family DNA binding protein
MDGPEAPDLLDRCRWVTPTEAAELIGVTAAHVRYLAREGLIESRKFGASWMIRRESIERYAAVERRPGPKPKE